MEEAARPGGPLGPGGAHALAPRVRFSLEHRGDLLADCPAADVAEMEAAVVSTLDLVAGARPRLAHAQHMLELCKKRIWPSDAHA